MPARFWFDKRDDPNAANGDPAAVIKGLADEKDGFNQLHQMFSRVYVPLKLTDKYALFMSGTTGELQGALTAAKDKGFESICVTDGQSALAVWYMTPIVRARFEFLVCVAGRGPGPQHYWRMNDNQTPADLAPPAHLWKVMPVFSIQRDSISLDDLIDAILKAGEAPPLPPLTDEQVGIKTDVTAFAYDQLSTLKNANTPGRIFTGYGDGDFYHLRKNDKVETNTDQNTWDYTGDKVHVSVDSKQVGKAWNVVLPILIGNHHTIKDFKITRMELVRGSLPDKSASRIYYGAQITVYFRAAPGNVKKDEAEMAAALHFAEVMKLVSAALKNASIGAGDRPASDQEVDTYLSFRRDYDDLINPLGFSAKKQYAHANGWTEDQAAELFYIRDTRDDYAVHKERMKLRPLFKLLELALS
jgi:hypothetical protein